MTQDGTESLRATRSGYDLVAADYAMAIGGELAGKPLDRALLAALLELAPDGPVADLGCGPGHVAAWLAQIGRFATGIDLSPAMCRLSAGAGVPAAAGDLAHLPLATGSCAAAVCLYAVIHLDPTARAAAYGELARVLRPGGVGLVAFHTSDAGLPGGGVHEVAEFLGHPVALSFRFLDVMAERAAITGSGLAVVAQLEREGDGTVEHPSRRAYLLVRKIESAN